MIWKVLQAIDLLFRGLFNSGKTQDALPKGLFNVA